MSKKGKNTAILIGAAVIVCAGVFGGLYATRNVGKTAKEISTENAGEKLNKIVKGVTVTNAEPVKSPVEYTDSNTDVELPDIETCTVSVPAETELYAEIYSSPEKAGSGKDGCLTEIAEKFNKAGYEVNGQPVSVQLRNVSSGLMIDYITSGKYIPDGFTPSSDLWLGILDSNGIKTEVIDDHMVGNLAGIVLSKDKYEEIVNKYGSIDMKSVTEAVENGELIFGYTNPNTSTTGMNYLINTLQRYDLDNPLSEKAAEGFNKFQKNIPFVAMTTVQMIDAAQKGSLDGFVSELQAFNNDANMSSNYKFTPFGYRHDNPLACISTISEDKKEILKDFAEFCRKDENQKIEAECGFNQDEDYKPEYTLPDGDVLAAAQKLYKENKDSGNTILAVFVTDVSGSMDGEPLNNLKNSLVNAMQYINTDNYVGMVSYSDDVTVNLPLDKFSLDQQSMFKGAVESLQASGGTATFDGIAVAMKMIEDKTKELKEAGLTSIKPMLFVLSDGETNSGCGLNDVEGIIQSFKIPIYTIGYNADLEALKKISSINEAASLNAETSDVGYQLKNLFNANM